MGYHRRTRMSAPRKKRGTKNEKQAATRDERAAAAAAREEEVAAAAEEAAIEEYEQEEAAAEAAGRAVKKPRPNTPADEELRRIHTVQEFERLGSPPESMWAGHGGTVSKIVDALKRKGFRISSNRRPLFRTLERHVAGEALATRGGGHPVKLTKGEALVAGKYVELGLGYEQVAYMVTGHRANKGKGPASRKAVETAFKTTLGGIARGNELGVNRACPAVCAMRLTVLLWRVARMQFFELVSSGYTTWRTRPAQS